MNTKYIIGGIVVAVIAVGAYMMTRPESSIEQQMTDQMGNRTTMRHSLREFMTMGGETMKCTYVSEDTTARTEGTTFIANGKVRSDSTITTKADGKAMTSSSIIDGTHMYAWGDNMPHGMKMSMSAMSDLEANAAQGNDTMGMDSQTEQYDTAYDYECEPWAEDGSFFAPPAGIEFMDYSEMMKGMSGMMQVQGGNDAGMVDGEMMVEPSSGAPSNAMMCIACEQAPDAESKAECKAAMGCQ